MPDTRRRCTYRRACDEVRDRRRADRSCHERIGPLITADTPLAHLDAPSRRRHAAVPPGRRRMATQSAIEPRSVALATGERLTPTTLSSRTSARHPEEPHDASTRPDATSRRHPERRTGDRRDEHGRRSLADLDALTAAARADVRSMVTGTRAGPTASDASSHRRATAVLARCLTRGAA